MSLPHTYPIQVIRSQSAALGPGHVDTQLIRHNLACVLDRLGRGHKAQELLEEAHEAFKEALGADHPRTQVTH